jgi:tetratricopeptide (TPR) repeat protein
MPARYLKPAICLVLLLATLAVYWPVKDHEFISLDDSDYVTSNFNIQGGLTLKGVRWAFTTTHAYNWHPVTWLSHMLDCQLYGLNPRGPHLTNVLLHVANTLLLFLFLAKITGALWPSALVAALFALHPLHVESVAWVAERKDVLSAFFFFTTLWAYVWYVAAPGWRRYLPVFFAFALGLMAKPMLVTLPFVLLLLDYWPLGRLTPPASAAGKRRKAAAVASRLDRQAARRLVWEKVPLLALTAGSCVITLVAQKKAMELQVFTPLDRIANVLVAYVRYLGKMLWPLNLAVFYPHPGSNLPLWQAGAAGLFLAGVTYLVLKKGRKHPYLPVGWFWYLGTLVPVIGLVQVGEQSIADRYTYIPLIGIFIILAWGAFDLTAAWRRQRLALSLGAAVLLPLLMILSWVQVSYWRNPLLLFEHAAQVTKNNYLAYSVLISEYGTQKKFDQALALFQETTAKKPSFPTPYNSMGVVYSKQERFEEAIECFKKAIQLDPKAPLYYNNLGKAYDEYGKIDAAISMYRKVIQLEPRFAEAYYSLGRALAKKGEIDESIALYKKAIQLKPDFAKAYNNLAINYGRQGKLDEAIATLKKAIEFSPSFSNAYCNLAIAYGQQGKMDAAIDILQKALSIDPENAKAKKMLDMLKKNAGY